MREKERKTILRWFSRRLSGPF